MSCRGMLIGVALVCACARTGPPTFGPKAGSGGASGSGAGSDRRGSSILDADGGSNNAGASGSAAGGGKGAAGSGQTAGAAAGAAGAAGTSQAAESGIKASDEVFRDDKLRTYELTFADADWNQLQQTATDEQYVMAMLSVDGEPVGKIGVRYKGATGTLQGCFTDGVQTCRKLSMKLKLNEYDPELRYRGLKKLNLHGSLNDPSHLHERLTYQLFREFDVLAPRSAHARVTINGEYRGLYNLTEEVDGRFTDYRFQGADGQGTLYKEAWPAKSEDPGYYTNAQQTNEGSPVDKVVRFAGELASAASGELGAVVTRWMDPDEALRYLAVHTTTKHWDGPLTFYCTAEYGCNNHNFLIYESATQDRFSLVAWDTDNTFYENVPTDQAVVPSWYEPPPECNFDAADGFLPPGCDRLVQGFVQLGLDKFGDTLAKFLEGPYQVSALQADVDRWAAQIDESVKTDPAGSGYEDWRGNVEFLKGMIQKRGDRAVMLRDSF